MIVCIEILEDIIRFALYSKKGKEKISKIKIIDACFNEENLEQITYELKKYLYENSIRTKKAFMSIKTPDVIMKLINLPKMSEKDCINAIKTNYKSYFPIDISKYKFDYRILTIDETLVKVLLTIVPNEISESCLSVMLNSGLNPMFMDIYQDCICRGIKDGINEKSIAVIIKFPKTINIVFIIKGEINLIRIMPLRNNEKDKFELNRIVTSECINLDHVYLDVYIDWAVNYFFEHGVLVSICNGDESLIGLIKE